ncbi:MAG TPA: cation diffusion facilitator family transporter [Solirubrobacterales bacterium]|nr:cation diffusion facilitator family transporter [Solirubrobacterales bacterium]
MTATRSGAAWLSVVSNCVLIVLKVVAGILTGSIAILTEAIHSAIDLVASLIALISVRKAEEPADEDHPYGHEKAENVAAGAEAMLILLGAAIIVIEAVRRLVSGSEIESVGIGIAIIAVSIVVNLVVSGYLYRRAHALESPALEGDAAHLRADALTSIAVLVGLVLVEVTGATAFDSIAALMVAGAIVITGIRLARRSGRVLMDEALPDPELDRIEEVIAAARPPAMAGYHKLRGRRAGSRRHVDLHVQFRAGTSLEDAHREAHRLRDAIEAEIPGAEVLIHVEPEGSYHPRGRIGPYRQG